MARDYNLIHRDTIEYLLWILVLKFISVSTNSRIILNAPLSFESVSRAT